MANIYTLEGKAAWLNASMDSVEALEAEVELEIAEACGEITPEIQDKLDTLAVAKEDIAFEMELVKAEIVKKPEQYLRWYKNVKADLDACKKAKAEIDKKRKAADNKLNLITDLLTEALKANNKTEIKEDGGIFKATLRSSVSTEYDVAEVTAPYREQILSLAGDLPAYISIETKILPSMIEKGAPLPQGFQKVTNYKAQVR